MKSLTDTKRQQRNMISRNTKSWKRDLIILKSLIFKGGPRTNAVKLIRAERNTWTERHTTRKLKKLADAYRHQI